MGFVRKLQTCDGKGRTVFHLVLIKPTRYDDQGYSVHWHRSPTPSNSLACLLALGHECRENFVLGPEVDICITPIDELAGPVDCEALTKQIRRDGGNALIGMVGVQSNQFPRAMDLAREFRSRGIPVCIGGFHVTGSLSMLDQAPPEIVEATQLGVSLFLGEAEGGRLAGLLRDAFHGTLQPYYDYRDDLPGLEGEPLPFLPREMTERSLIQMTCMDLGRGCPFDCSFCCIINVQGKKSRHRTADDLEKILIHNHRHGIHRYFITDDNFARNRNWKPLLERMIEVQRREGFKLKLGMQVDMMCHKVPGFIEKAAEAGAELVFCGLESINPDSLKHMKKPQNRLSEYRRMLLEWKKRDVLLAGGYIMGLPDDTPASILDDIDTIKRELPIDLLHFSIITPLPGSRDHKDMLAAGEWMDPDLNKYDLTNVVIKHPRMSAEELAEVFREATRRFYTDDHMETVMRRTAALGGRRKRILASRFKFYGLMMVLHGLYSLDAGLFRVKHRLSRRPGYGRENWLLFHAKYYYAMVRTSLVITREMLKAVRTAKRVWAEVRRDGYQDSATFDTPDRDDALLKLYPQAARAPRGLKRTDAVQPG